MLFKKCFLNLVFLTKGEVSHPHTKYPLNTKKLFRVCSFLGGEGQTVYYDAGIGQASLAGIIGFFGMIGMMFSQAWLPSVMHDFCKNPI